MSQAVPFLISGEAGLRISDDVDNFHDAPPIVENAAEIKYVPVLTATQSCWRTRGIQSIGSFVAKVSSGLSLVGITRCAARLDD